MGLEKYRVKRSPEKTPEPFGTASGRSGRPGLFVVQKHAARRLHYDFRLEWGGVLRSWAVPNGPCLDPAVKRLAVEVEDHPVEYADFEGSIPDGNYGAGTVIVWDQGRWEPLEDFEEGLRKGKILFDLKGYKLRGVWQLVRTKSREKKDSKEWLLIKKPDAWSRTKDPDAFPQESIFSGLTLEERREGSHRAEEIRARLVELKAPRRAVDPAKVELMLAELRDAPIPGDDWLWELKYDGYRVLAAREAAGAARLLYRRGNDATAIFPEIARTVAALPFASYIVDGEAVVLDEKARPSFQRLQKRSLLTRRSDIERATVDLPATLFVFDLLAFEDFDLRGLPLHERKELLRRLLPRAGPLRYADHIVGRGPEMIEQVRAMGLEGIVGKKADGPYRPGRSRDWIKIRLEKAGDFAIVGFTEPRGSRAGFGALHLAAWDKGTLLYAGRVGSGFTEKQLADARETLRADQRPDAPCEGPVPKGREHTWVEPRLVCEVRYKEWTNEKLLRQPVFLRFREDKKPEDAIRERGEAPDADAEADADAGPPKDAPAPRRSVKEAPAVRPKTAALVDDMEKVVPFSNLSKIFWPEEKYTKGELLGYYRDIAPWLLPYLKDRPIVMTRYPDGITGKSFFQKDAPNFAPGWVRTERIWSDVGREIDYFVCDDVESLLYIVNLGSIPLHVWSSRVGSLEKPDWCILDLDPKGAPFADVVKVARTIHELCEEIELPAFIKTSGATGLHVLIPLGARLTHAESKAFGEILARTVERRVPEISTTARMLGARGGKVYIDFLQNGHGKTIAGIYSARPVAGATCSAPLHWKDVSARLDPRRYTIKTLPARMKRLGEDPVLPVLTLRADLERALARLTERLRVARPQDRS
jgi:bifunctional non-homologous end joining protein LigD